ncbi:coiled-coil domain-containing protein 142 isoform X2 [Apteryx mantelli]|uniref:Coiled-coil domain-containing protein 142 isoform X2 n=1 Tax=Apteryx mantelli TaxID=2696672 RepID=A0ABM4EPC1_9AVES
MTLSELVAAGGIGPDAAILLLLMSRLPQAPGSGVLPPLRTAPGPPRAPPSDGAAGGEPEEPPRQGGGSPARVARSPQEAEAVLRSCANPGPQRPPFPCPGERSYDSDDEDSPDALAQVEQSFLGLRRCFCVWEDPRTETFRGHVRPQPGDAAHAAFSYHPVHPRMAKHCAALHALLQHRHHLRLSREYCRRLKGASDFVRRLLLLVEQPGLRVLAGEPGAARPLRGLCEELRTHASHWSGLQRRMRGDPWLRPLLLLHGHESVRHMKQALALLALHAARLVESYAEALLRGLARAGPAAATPALLADLFQGLEIYNRVVGDLALELGSGSLAARHGAAGTAGDCSQPFPVDRVLAILAAERGGLAAERLHQLLLRQRGRGDKPERVRREDAVVPPDCRSVDADAGSPGRPGREELTRLPEELQALCREDKELVGLVLGVLVASTDSLRHRVLNRPKQETVPAAERPEAPALPAAGPGAASRPGSPGWRSARWLDASRAEAAEALHARYSPLCWEAAGAALAHRLEVPREGRPLCGAGAAAALARELSRALGQACLPPECEEELRRLCLRLLCHGVFQSWDRGFARALGSGLSDKCCAEPEQAAGAAQSRTARLLQQLYPALAFALRRLEPRPAGRAGGRPGSPDLRLQLLGRCVATAQAAGSWLMSKAYRYLASWSLRQFLLVAQADLQLLRAETEKLMVLVNVAFPEPGDGAERPPSTLLSHQEQQLCRQIRSTAASIQLFSEDVMRLFSTDCKRMSAEIFDRTMPLGKHWRLGLRPELPSCPGEYAAAAAQTVLGQVLQGVQLLPRDCQAPTLARVVTAFVEAWMDHILARKIKFSLQGALQLKQDFDLVRELVQSEHYGLAPEVRQSLLSLRVFQQMDAAILCLLQQPSGKACLPSHAWQSLRRCCSSNGVRRRELGAGSLNSLESLEAPGAAGGAERPGRLRSGVPESYLSGSQQQWLALRLHGRRRWRVPGLPCGTRAPES